MIWMGIGAGVVFGLLFLGARVAESHRRQFDALSRRLDDLADAVNESVETLAALRERVEAREIEVRVEPDPVPVPAVETALPVSRLEGRIEALASAIDELQSAAKAEPKTPEVAAVPPFDPREAIEAFLGGMGYEDVAYLGGRGSEEPLESGRVSLSARKRGILYKGHAIVEGGRVKAANLLPSHGMFP